MKEEITQEYIRELFDYKDGILYWKISNSNRVKIGVKAGTLNKITGYYTIRINNKKYQAHRIIFLYHYKYLPKFIDHIDQDKLNNNIENLRSTTLSQNQWNRKSNKNSSSKYKGVTWDKSRNKWAVQIRKDNKYYNLGRFINEKEAAITYNIEAIKLFGEFAYLNKIGDD